MKRCLLWTIGITLMVTSPVYATPSENYISLKKSEFPCQLEEDFDYDRDIYVQMGKTGERIIRIKQRHFSFNGREMVCDTFVHGGMLYVPVRQTAEFLNKIVTFSSKDQCVFILDSSSEPKQMNNAQIGELSESLRNKKISVSHYPVYYNNMKLEGKVGFLSMKGIFSCEGRLYMPLKTLTEQENIIRIYKDDNVFLLDDFLEGKIIKTPFKVGVSEKDVLDIDDEVLKKALIKIADNCSEPGNLTSIEGKKALYYGKPAIVVKLNVVRMYEYGLAAFPEIEEGYIYVLEE